MPRRHAPSSLAFALLTLTVLTLTVAAPLAAVVPPEETPLRAKSFRHHDLAIDARIVPPGEAQAAALAALGVAPEAAYLDARTGRWATLMAARPLLPGQGVGNELTWEDLAVDPPADRAAYGRRAWEAFAGTLRDLQAVLGIDVAELPSPGRVTVHDDGELVQIYARRQVGGIAVRDSYVTAVVRHGNLVLFGASRWAEVTAHREPAISADQAEGVVASHLDGAAVVAGFGKSGLEFVPVAAGDGLAYRLAWVLRPRIDGDLGTWEALVDAASGKLLAFADLNQYATARQVEGGVFPETNDGIGPEGTEQPDFPMPFADLSIGIETFVTDAGGNLTTCVDGEIETRLSGPYMTMSDDCGAISESTTGDVLDLGVSGGTDCAVPAGASPGNTHSSRSGFYEMNRMMEMARGQLPDNVWLTQQLTANMNIDNFCNAFWSGSVNFYRSGGGCFNTGEIAGVFDHEWGHGMDDNDAVPTISSPSGEGIADIYAAIRLNTSCIGRGFRATNCTGFGDPCLDCTGVRDIDYLKRASGLPHTYTWSNANCTSTHCRGQVYSEAVWSLWKRKLQSPPYNLDNNTAHEIVNRLTFLGGGAVTSWYSGSPPFGGCGAASGYLSYLAVDDDDGDLTNGTPHMQAIFDAFNDQEIACATPAVQDSGCAGAPTTAPAVVATAIDRGARLTWEPVAGATGYRVFRTDGVLACDFGKTLVGETTGTSFVDGGLKNGREHYYVVIPIGPDAACFGPASSCTAVTPTAGANLGVAGLPASLTLLGGDGDPFLDNCEQLTVGIEVSNIGTGPLTHVRIVAAEAVDNPEVYLLNTFPAAVDDAMAACEVSTGEITIQAGGLSGNDLVEIRLEVTADEIAPQTRSQIVRIALPTEGDSQFFATKTFTFETDLEGWEVTQGTFFRTAGGGGDGTTISVDSSAFLDDQCDQIRSPVMSLAATSTLSLWNNYDIEPMSGGSWYDRANVGFVDVLGSRTVVDPDGGRTYNATGAYGGCNSPGGGWADLDDTWGTSSWSAAALDAPGRAGQAIRLDVVYSTDGGLANRGFWFDEVTVTDVELQVPDTQPDVCVVAVVFDDGFESGDTSAWTSTVP